ncbi:MAG: hypothetical protein ACRCS9_03810 [Hyphomicrobium sp.]
MPDENSDDRVVRFPYSKVAPAQSSTPNQPELYGDLAARIGMPQEQTTGHWCSRCNRIWYGYLLEVACPQCGNRHG